VPDPFAPLAKSAGFDISPTLFLPLRPPPPFHGFTQELVDPGLVSASLALQPGQHIGIRATVNLPSLLRRPSNISAAPSS
jgi:hypothetical protein